MKKPLLIIILLALFSASVIQAATTYTSTTTGGLWSAGTTWVGGTAPSLPTDNVVIATTGNNSVNIKAAASITDLTINTGATLRSALPAVTFTFTISGNIVNNGTISTANTGITYDLTGTVKTITLASAANTAIGNLKITGTITNLGYNGSGQTAPELAVATSLSGTGTLTNGLSLNGGAAFLSIGGTCTISNLATSVSGNTVMYNGNADQTCKAGTYSNLRLLTTVVTIYTRTFPSSITVNGILSFHGSAKIAFTTGSINYGTGATLKYNTDQDRTVSSVEWITPFTASGGILIINTGKITLNEPKTISKLTLGDATITGQNAYLYDGGYQITGGGSGTCTLGANTVLYLGSTSSTNATVFPTGFTTYTLNATSTVAYQANAAQVIAARTYGNLELNTGATPSTKTTAGTFTVQNTLTNNANTTLAVASGHTVTVTGALLNNGIVNDAGSLTLNGSLTNSGTITNTSFLNHNGTGTSNGTITNTGTFTNNGTLDGSGTITNAAGTFDVNGSTTNTGTFTNNALAFLAIQPGKTLSSATLTNNGTFTNDGTVTNSVALTNGGALTVNGILTCNGTFTNNAPGAMEIPASGKVTCIGTLSNTAGNAGILVRAGGSLIESTTNVPATVEVACAPTKWHLISSPVADQTSNLFKDFYLQYFTQSTNTYYDILPTTNSLVPMQGYAFYGDGALLVPTFTGHLNAGTVGASNNVSRRIADDYISGWNLVGNPYPSYIDWSAVSGWTKTNVRDAIYLDKTDGSFATYVGGVGANGGTRYIAPGQGFFVSADLVGVGTLKMTDAVRVHNAATFYKNSNEVVPNLVRLEVSGNGLKDEAVVRFTTDATPDFDSQFDALKMFSSVPEAAQIYSTGGEALSINSMPETTSVPVGLRAAVTGSYTIAATELNDLHFVTLEDSQTGIFTDLEKGAYTFNAVAGANENRFILHFSALGVNEKAAVATNIYSFQKNVFVNMKDETKGDIYIYNISGQLVSTKLAAQGMNEIGLTVSGNYIVKVITRDNTVVSKVFVQ